MKRRRKREPHAPQPIMWPIVTKKIGYEDRVAAIADELPPGVHIVDVMHDHDCPQLRGGACMCTPEIEVRS